MSAYRPDPDSLNDWGQRAEQAGNWIKWNLPRIVPAIGGLVVVLWLISGVYVVGPGQKGVVRTFGKETARTDPGLNYRYPWPFQKADVVSVEQVRRIEVGFRGTQRVSEEALMLTGSTWKRWKKSCRKLIR